MPSPRNIYTVGLCNDDLDYVSKFDNKAEAMQRAEHLAKESSTQELIFVREYTECNFIRVSYELKIQELWPRERLSVNPSK